ncbi:MAG: iron-containing alcohol dehydrogenase, partial [Rubrivivax sp.]
MQNFSFHNPTAIDFGTGAIAQLGQRVPSEARVLLLYGGSSAERNGTLAEVRQALQGRLVQEFGGIEPNPSYETLMRAVEQVRSQGLDFLLA